MKSNISIFNSIKWSLATEIIGKLIQPITNMILARILAPEAFGVVSTISMITSFADMFTDAGFQKYIVQHEFEDKSEKELSINVVFWTNLFLSIIIWIIIIVFSDEISNLVGNPGLGFVISIACVQLPLTSFSSIQMAIYRRSFNFKTLFIVRIVGILIPFLITIPLAFKGYSYWALIIGTICGTLSNAVILTLNSEWKPKFEYSTLILRKMLSYGMWSLADSIAKWLTVWIDIFIIGSVLNSYYVGLFKTSVSTVNSIITIITGATTPVMFSALSRAQNNNIEFKKIFLTMQKSISYLILPLSIGIFIFRDTIVMILLGNQWIEASYIVGIWGLVSGIMTLLSHYVGEVFKAKGKPKLSFISEIIYLLVLIPICIKFSKYKFLTFITARTIVRMVSILSNCILMKKVIDLSIMSMIKNMTIPMISSIIMGILGYKLSLISNSLVWQIISIFICIILYSILLISFKSSRNDIIMFINKTNIINKLHIKRNIKNKLSNNI